MNRVFYACWLVCAAMFARMTHGVLTQPEQRRHYLSMAVPATYDDLNTRDPLNRKRIYKPMSQEVPKPQDQQDIDESERMYGPQLPESFRQRR